MKRQLIWLIAFLGLLLLLIFIAELLHKRFKWAPERSRKFLHVSGGLICLLFPSIFSSHWYVLILAGSAFLILLFTYRKRLLPSIHLTNRYSVGSVIFPVPVYFSFLVAEWRGHELFFYLPIALLALADTAAEAGGNRWGHAGKQFFRGQKSLAGTLCFFAAALIICFILLGPVYHFPLKSGLVIGLLVAIISTITELVTLHGWDNLSIPAVTILILLFFL